MLDAQDITIKAISSPTKCRGGPDNVNFPPALNAVGFGDGDGR